MAVNPAEDSTIKHCVSLCLYGQRDFSFGRENFYPGGEIIA